MNCKVCGKPIEGHKLPNREKCLKEGFGITMAETAAAIIPSGWVVSLNQPAPNKKYFEIALKDQTVVRTYDLLLSYAEILLTRVYAKPKKELSSEVAEDVPVLVNFESPIEDNNDTEPSNMEE